MSVEVHANALLFGHVLKPGYEKQCCKCSALQLESVSSAKYLCVDISSDLSWDTHINRISKKANNTHGFLRRNIMIYSESLKSSACKVLVHPKLEYCSTVCVHSQIQISLNLKLSNIELPNGSNMAMDRLPVSQTWCNSLLCIKSLTL